MRFLTGLFFALLVVGLFVFGLNYYSEQTSTIAGLSSPIPDSLSKFFYPTSKTNSLWLPATKQLKNSSVKEPTLLAKSAFSYDLTTNTVLFSKNSTEKLPIASLTKIMTAIVTLENLKSTDKVVVDSKAATIGEDSMGLTVGEKLTVQELMYGLFLNSGNDAAEALAEGSPFGRENFIYQMNKKAEDLGLSATHFTNPSGLQGDGKQYSTAEDLLVITRYALEKPLIAEVAQLPYFFIPYTSDHKAFELYNETNLLTTYPGVKGMKTGYTDEAGLCLITYLEYRGHKIIAVILNSPSRRDEMIQILDYSLKTLGVTPPQHG